MNMQVYNQPARAQSGSWWAESNASEGGGHGSIVQDVARNTNPGDQFAVSCWLRSPQSGTVSGTLALWGLLGSGNEAGSTAFTVGSTWTQVSFVTPFGGGHTKLRIQMYMGQAGLSYDTDSCSIRQQYS